MRWLRRLVLALLAGGLALAGAREPGTVIQSAELDATHAYFIPTHPRVTTTVRFPREIGPPEGAVGVFTEDAQRQAGEFLVGWQSGDSYFTILPLRPAALANLNVPYRGETYVLYFYAVTDPLLATAALNLVGPDPEPSALPSTDSSTESRSRVVRQSERPPTPWTMPSPARLVGFLDRLKLIHATPPGPVLRELAGAMGVDVAMARDEASGPNRRTPGAADGIQGVYPMALNDAGYFQIVLLRAVRDRRLNCVGFICLLRNTSNETLTFDVNSFGARAGAEYLTSRIADADPTLAPGEQVPAYFVVHPTSNSPLLAANDWRISVDLVSPRPNPGAAVGRQFGLGNEAR